MARLFDDEQNERLVVNTPVVSSVPVTMAAWAKTNAATTYQCLLSLCRPSGNDWFALAIWNDNKIAADCKNATRGTAKTTATCSVNTWFHACAVFASSSSRFAYVHGANKGTNETDLTPEDLTRTCIGALYINYVAWPMSGAIAGPAIWNAALIDEEVASLADGAHPTTIRPDNLVAFWPLGGFDGQHDRDIWGGYDMTPYSDDSGPIWADHPGGLIPPASPLTVIASAAAPTAHAGPLVNRIPIVSKLQGVAA